MVSATNINPEKPFKPLNPFKFIRIQDPTSPDWVYVAQKKGDEVIVRHYHKNPKPEGLLGTGGTMQTMSMDEFKVFLKELLAKEATKDTFRFNAPPIPLERVPGADSFVKSA